MSSYCKSFDVFISFSRGKGKVEGAQTVRTFELINKRVKRFKSFCQIEQNIAANYKFAKVMNMVHKKTAKQNIKAIGLFNLKPVTAAIRLALGGVLISSLSQTVYAELPVAAKNNWVSSGGASKVTSGSRMDINQTTHKAILNWQKFNIGAGNHVNFKQPTSSSTALNKIAQSDPSKILGKLTANGQLYLINQNGFIFGENSVVDVASLIASTHDISEKNFLEGITEVFKNGDAAFELEDAFRLDAENNKVLKEILIKQGAKITASDNGNIIIVAPKVENNADLQTGNFGQIILVASQDKVYLQQSESDDFKRLLVEVETGGDVSNFGNILAKQGDITMAGFMVNQSGRVNATSSSTINGTVRLLAREGAEKIGQQLKAYKTTRETELDDNLGLESFVNIAGEISIKADENAGSDVDGQIQPEPLLDVSAHTVILKSGSRVIAPNAKVNIVASDNINGTTLGDSGRIVMEKGSVIDVSGEQNVKVAIERNIGEVDAISSLVLRDSPNQRGGILAGEKLAIDLRKDTTVVDAEGAKKIIQRSVSERMTEGGDVNMTASGEIAIHDGAVIDISGGSIAYQDGNITTTQLINSAGQQVDVGDANPDDTFVSIFKQTYFEKGYVEGKDAGSLKLNTASLDWKGQLKATAVNGRNQRTRETMAKGGEMAIDLMSFQSAQNIAFQSGNAMAKLSLSGLQDFALKTLGEVSIDKNTNLIFNPYSSISILADKGIQHQGKIYTAGGKIILDASDSGSIRLASGSKLDVSGRWINDFYTSLKGQTPTEVIVKDAGTITLTSQNDLEAVAGSHILADGGAHFTADGKLDAGNGGQINLQAQDKIRDNKLSFSEANISAQSLQKNGSLSLSADEFKIANKSYFDQQTAINYLSATDALFSDFSEVSLNAETDISLSAQANINATQKNLQLNNNYYSQQSQQSIKSFSRRTTLPEYLRSKTSLDLTAGKTISMAGGSSILTDASSSVSFIANENVFVDGLISTPAGNINLQIKPLGVGVFKPDQAVWLGENARLLAKGKVKLEPDPLFRTGTVYSGGDVNIEAEGGYVVFEQGAKIDVSGTSAALDVAINGSPFNGYKRRTIGSNAGSISLTAAEGMVIAGDMKASAGTGANFNGSLAIELSRAKRIVPENEDDKATYPTDPLVIALAQKNNSDFSNHYQFGDSLATELPGVVNLYTDNLAASNFDFISLKTPDNIRFEGEVDLTANVGLKMDAAAVEWAELADVSGNKVNISAPHIELSSSRVSPDSDMAKTGEGIFNVQADWLKLHGLLKVQGAKQVNLLVKNDIQAVALHQENQKDFTGEFVTAANLDITASKIYPSTLSKFRFAVENNTEGNINIFASNGNSSLPLSAGGELTFQATHINQSGTLLAPLGKINLLAEKTLTLAEGSLTSVSAKNLLIPVGNVVDGLDWVYPLGFGVSSEKNLLIGVNTTLDKKVLLKAPDIITKQGAVVDLAGGGDVFSYEFVAGLGGSTDYLQPGSDSYQNSFAILPTLGTTFSPYDHVQSNKFSFVQGETVVLAGGNGTPAGEFAKLPAHYALLPGAFLVTPVENTVDHGQTTFTLDGRPVVSGFSSIAGVAKGDARRSGFMVENGDQVRKQSEYVDYRGDVFIAEKAQRDETRTPVLAKDGGLVSIQAQTRLVMDGIFNVDAPNGIGARMDIAANAIRVTEELSAEPEAGVLEILASNLSDLNIASLLLGGERSLGSRKGETVIEVGADTVTFEQDAEVDVDDLVIVAKDTVKLKTGAIVSASNNANTGDELLTVKGEGALLRVSGAQQVDVNRVDFDAENITKGQLLIEQGATLAATQSMLFDSSLATDISGEILMDGGSLNLAANSINIGEIAGNGDSALNLSNAALAKMTVDELVLTSRDAINFYGTTGQLDADGIFKRVTGGNISPINISKLSINAAGLIGHAVNADSAADSVNIKVKELELKNTLDVIASLPATGQGSLNIETSQMTTGDGDFVIDGFNKVNLAVNNKFKAEGEGSLDVNADLTLKTALLTAGSLGDYHIDATGHQAEFMGTGAASTEKINDLTGQLAITADRVTLNTRVDLASGAFDIKALQGDVEFLEQADIDLSGRIFNFSDVTKHTSGGNLNVTSDKGSIRFLSGSKVDLNGGDDKSHGGQLRLAALKGNVNLDGRLTAQGGSIDINVKGFEDQSKFSNLFAKIEQARTTKSIRFRSAEEDITLAADSRITAEQVKLSTDNGAINILGSINADAEENSVIKLIANEQVVLASSATLSAQTQSTKQGGKVLLSTTDKEEGGIQLASGSVINVSNAEGENGEVVLRAPRVEGQKAGIKISQLKGEVLGTSGNGFYAEGVEIYQENDGSISAADIAQYKADTDDFMTDENRVEARQLHKDLKLRAGIEVQSSGDLELAAELNTASWRYSALEGEEQAAVGQFVIRSAGNLELNNSISDGYNSALLADDSWSFVLASGADLKSADLSEVTDSGDLTVNSNVMVRTGTGDISLYSAGDVELKNQTSVIYNMGRQTAEAAHGIDTRPSLKYEYPVQGGDIEIIAGGSVKAAVSDQFMNEWLNRSTKIDRRLSGVTAWGVVLNKPVFQQNIGSFGGGNVSVSAGKDINNLNIMMPTTGKPTGIGLTPEISGGGRMRVLAAGNISGGAYLLGQGQAEITAGKSVQGGSRFTEGPVIAIGDGQVNITAGDDVQVSAVVDPMILHDNGVNFFSYTDESAVSMTSLSGDVYLSSNRGGRLQQDLGTKVITGELAAIYPGLLNVTAMDGSIFLKNNITLFPSSKSQLNLLAENQIRPALSNKSGRINLAMSDADSSILPRAKDPVAANNIEDIDIALNPFNFTKASIHAAESLHKNNPEPVRLVTKKGNIQNLAMIFPKHSVIQAGNDLAKNQIYIQHVNAGDYSTISAGRDLTSASGRDFIDGVEDPNNDLIEISGPGDVIIKTGRDLDLGRSAGIKSVGNQSNKNLAETGANLTFLVGTPEQPDYVNFIQKMHQFKVDHAEDEITQSSLFKVFEILASIDESQFQKLDSANLNKLIMPLFFKALKEGGKAESLDNVLGNAMGFHAIEALFPEHKNQGDLKMFFSTIQTENGGDINIAVPGGGINVGLASVPSEGAGNDEVLGILAIGEGEVNAFLKDDFDVNQSRVFTLQGEDILVWSSEGDIDAGKGGKAAFSTQAPLISYVDDKVVVKAQPNIGGSGINADFKTLSTSEISELLGTPQFASQDSTKDYVEKVNKLLADKSNTVSEKAIARLQAISHALEDNVDAVSEIIDLAIAPASQIAEKSGLLGLQGSGFLFAPKGIINASEAGISANNLFIVAKAVLGSSNISVSGSSTGVPSQGSSAPTVTGLSNSTTSVSKAAEQSVQGKSTEENDEQIALGMLSVDVVGFGSEQEKKDCKDDGKSTAKGCAG